MRGSVWMSEEGGRRREDIERWREDKEHRV